MILDLMTGAQDATIALLRDQLPAEQRGMVRHSPKENAVPPWHLVGDINADSEDDKGEQLEKLTVDIHTVYRGSDRRELLALLHQVHLATRRAKVDLAGANYRFRWLGAIASTAASDGVTYAGVTTIEVTAQPA